MNNALETYLQHLNDERWVMVRHINGRGVEVSRNTFNVLPKAIKIVTEDDPVIYKDYARFRVADIENPVEIGEDSLDYCFITLDNPPCSTILQYAKKVKEGGKFILHNSIGGQWYFHIQQKVDGILIPYELPQLPTKNVGIMRFGAIGDLFQTSSVAAAFKRLGYHVTIYAQGSGAQVLENNPNVDVIIATDREIIRNAELRPYWDWLATQHSRFVNLCGSVEDAWLPNKSSPRFHWPAPVREKYMSTNYVQFSHELAGVPYKLDVKFYPTQEEIEWADEERKKFPEKKLICYALNGSSLHKVFPHMDEFIARVMLYIPQAGIVTLGDEQAQLLESGWDNEPRVHRTAGTWSIRQSLTFIQRHANVLIGPETGLLNAMCTERLHKIIFLSHSNINNLTRDWVNTTNMIAPAEVRACCDNCCMHRLHMNDDGFKYLKRDDETGVAHCQAGMDRNKLFETVKKVLK